MYNITGTILNFFNGIFNNYLLAILAIALIVKLLMLPFGIKQQKNSIKQAKLSPKEQAIRKKYAGRTDQASQQKMQQEIMELYQTGGYSPLSGCLPLLIQFPIIILLYNTIMNPLRYMVKLAADQINAIAGYINTNSLADLSKVIKEGVYSGRDIELLKFITPDNIDGINSALTAANQSTISLSQMPNLDLFGLQGALANNPSLTTWLILIPILNVLASIGTTLLTKKLTFQPMQNGRNQGKIMNIVMTLVMPAFTGWIAFQVPAAIGIYWLFNTILSIIQTVILYFAFPLPKFTEEDYKQAEREMKGKGQQVASRAKVQQISSVYLEDDSDDEIQYTPGDDDGDD